MTRVEQFFLSLKDSGMALSASDYHLISQWEQRHVPEDLLCRCIETCYVDFIKSSRNPDPKVSLSQLRESIEIELKQAPQ